MNSPAIRVRLLVDDRAGEGLVAEHGLSMLVEASGSRILLDTGKGEALAANADRLAVDLADVDIVVLSHGHYDHTGGLPALLKDRQDLEVYFHPAAFRSRYTVDQRGARQIGMPLDSVQAIERMPGRRLHGVTANLRLSDIVGIAAPILRETDFEDTGGAFFLDPDAMKPDPIEDDLVVWIRSCEGLILLVGCCHAGIVNTITHVKRAAGETRVRAIIGGLHLLHADYRRLDPTMAALQTVQPETLIPCHCTGERAVRALQETFGTRVTIGQSGAIWEF